MRQTLTYFAYIDCSYSTVDGFLYPIGYTGENLLHAIPFRLQELWKNGLLEALALDVSIFVSVSHTAFPKRVPFCNTIQNSQYMGLLNQSPLRVLDLRLPREATHTDRISIF